MDTAWLTGDGEQGWRDFRRLLTVLPARLSRDLVNDSGLSTADYEVLSTRSESESRIHKMPVAVPCA